MPATKFDKPVFPGAKLVSATVTVTNTSGSYSNTFTDERIATSMRAFQLEIEDPSVFNDKISITTADGSFTIACDSVAGETDVTIGFLKIADDPTAVTSSEFTVLNNRIGDLSDLETTDQTSMVNAVNEVVGDVSDNTQAIANLSDKIPNIPRFCKMLREDGINKEISSSINVSDLSKYTVFAADLVSNWAGGAAFGLRVSATTIRFFGTSLASGGVLTHSILFMTVSGDNITGWDSGTYGTKWGDSVSGIRNLRGIC